MRRSARRRRVVADLALTLSPGRQSVMTMRFGTVTAVDAGAATDGADQATVTIRGNDVLASYLDTYTPTVDDVVAVVLVDGSPFILGKRVGTPTF
jgi:hypothetical protein